MSYLRIFALNLVLLLIAMTEGKTVRKVFNFREIVLRKHWLYITKFGMERGTGTYEFRARILNLYPDHIKIYAPIPFHLHVYLDVEWSEAASSPTCFEKINHARARDYFTLPQDGEWSATISSTLSQRLRDYLWFFVISDCEKHSENHDNRLMLEIEMTIKNSDESHFSVEENGMLNLYAILMLFSLTLLAFNSHRLYQNKVKEGIHDYALGMLTAVLFSESISLIFDSLRLNSYKYDGINSTFNESFAHIFSITSGFVMSCLLIFFSYGWTITVANIKNLEHFWPLYVIIGFFQVLIAGISRVTDDERYKKHNYEGIAGIFVLLMKIAFYAYFSFNMKNLIATVRDEKVKKFLKKFWFFGTVYYLTFPILLIINSFVAPYLQHKFMTIGNLTVQFLTILLFSFLFISKGEYYQISLKSKSILPSFKLD